ncbi:MAG: UPF0149 family protein, partial [Burkholderiales bacterium]
MTASAPRPLSDPEIASLDTRLGEIDPEHSMAVEEFDGFCAALACCPEPIAREEWLPLVLGESERAVAALRGTGADASVLKLIDRHRESVVADLGSGEGFAPVLSQDEEGRTWGHAWAIGFARAMALRPDAWDDLDTDEEMADALDPLMRLVAEAQAQQQAQAEEQGQGQEEQDSPAADSSDDADFGLDEDWPPIADDERPTVIHDMLDGVQDVFAFFAPARRKALAP